jgi:opacity protein-like surface antigen
MRHIGRAIVFLGLAAFAAGSVSWAAGPRHFPRGGAASGPDGSIRLSVGLFTPDGDSQFWEDSAIDFTGSADDFEDSSYRAELEWGLGQRASVLLSLGYYDGSTDRAYRDFVDGDGFDIVHTASLEVTPLTLGVLLAPGGRDKRVVPYLIAGVGFYSWRYTEVGDFIDFDDPEQPIIFGAFEADGVTTGLYAGAGIDLMIAPVTSLFVEGRWVSADDEMADDFDGFGTLDLSGSHLSLGISWKF